ncbi:murein biosynthesis integral membrane protein MurJ [Rhabdochromatium marinum]|uniref:murein biosynthesis integral membrane protein MurJ n=1 Tax=Rhabdochromatium marinum TaxID=48729 RepID=UPI001908DCFB|nr:murein biosynthesis integral membrane protein MurJ [Rhabdochromatium marinum]MBK1647028.1 murein biosynthesis integral membrane protein MurJ [Rhabdochromatium marinum]
MPQPEPSASLAKPVARIGGATLVSRLLGFARDLLIARIFGATQATDAFFVAFRIPNLMRRLFAEGAFAATLVPILTHVSHEDPHQARTRALIGDFAGSLSALLLLLSALGLVAAPVLVLLLAPGFSADASQQQLSIALVRLTLPYLWFVGLTALAGAVLNTFEHFAIPAITPALLNLSLIGCMLLLAPHLEQPIFALAWGVLLGGIAQLALQLMALARMQLLVIPRVNWQHPAWQGFLRALGPTLIGMSVTQINLLLDTLLASLLITGSISWLYYAERLMDFPLGILGAALGTAILPRLSRTHRCGDTQDFTTTLDWALRWVLVLGLPAAAGLLVLAEPVITTLFYSDQFNAADVRAARSALMAYALGLPGFLAFKIIVPSFFSRADRRTPLRIGLLTIALNLLLGLLLMGPLGQAGLALATSLAASGGAILLLRALRPAPGAHQLKPGWPALLARVLLSTLMMGAVLGWLGAHPFFEPLSASGAIAPDAENRAFAAQIALLSTLILTGALSYGAFFLTLGGRLRQLFP